MQGVLEDALATLFRRTGVTPRLASPGAPTPACTHRAGRHLDLAPTRSRSLRGRRGRAERARRRTRGRARASAHRDPWPTTPTWSSPTRAGARGIRRAGSPRSGGATSTASPTCRRARPARAAPHRLVPRARRRCDGCRRPRSGAARLRALYKPRDEATTIRTLQYYRWPRRRRRARRLVPGRRVLPLDGARARRAPVAVGEGPSRSAGPRAARRARAHERVQVMPAKELTSRSRLPRRSRARRPLRADASGANCTSGVSSARLILWCRSLRRHLRLSPPPRRSPHRGRTLPSGACDRHRRSRRELRAPRCARRLHPPLRRRPRRRPLHAQPDREARLSSRRQSCSPAGSPSRSSTTRAGDRDRSSGSSGSRTPSTCSTTWTARGHACRDRVRLLRARRRDRAPEPRGAGARARARRRLRPASCPSASAGRAASVFMGDSGGVALGFALASLALSSTGRSRERR